MNTQTIVVIGASGNVGRRLTARLLERGAAVRAIGRDVVRLAGLATRGAETAAGDVSDTAFLARAFRGAEAVFSMIPPCFDATDFRSWQSEASTAQVEALRQAGVPRVVTLSSVGAHLPSGTGPIAGLHDHEQRLNELDGVAVLHLRPAFFMENHLFSLGLIKAQGIIGTMLRGDLAFPQIATSDIADRAAAILLERSWSGAVVEELLGPADHSMEDTTRVLGAAIGRPDLPYVQLPQSVTEQAMLGMGMSPSTVATMIELDEAINNGVVGPERSRTAAATTPTTLVEFARTVFAPAFRAA